MANGHFIFASSEDGLQMSGANPRKISQVQKVWFMYKPQVFSIWERTLNLSNVNMEWRKKKHNQYTLAFPHYPVYKREELFDMLSRYKKCSMQINLFQPHNALSEQFDLMNNLDLEILCLCTLIVEQGMAKEARLDVEAGRPK